MGPLGILFAIQAVVAAVDFFWGVTKKAEESTKNLNKELKNQIEILKLSEEQLLNTNLSLEDRIKVLGALSKLDKQLARDLKSANHNKELEVQILSEYLSKKDYDLCTFPNAYLNMTFWSVGVVLGGAFLYYMYLLVNESIMPILILIFCVYGCWDGFPIFMLQNGWKNSHLFLWDTMVTGVLGLFIALYLVKYYYKTLEKYYILLIFTSIISYFILFYHWFKISKSGCSNWLVKLGDYLHIDKLVETIRIF